MYNFSNPKYRAKAWENYRMSLIIGATLLLLVFLFQSCASIKLYEKDGKLMGVLPLENGKVVYRMRYDSQDLPKEEVFKRARRWCVLSYRSSNDVLQLVDKETGEIIGKGNSSLIVKPNKGSTYLKPYQINHVILIDTFEDGYQLTLTGMEVYSSPQRVGNIYVPGATTPIERYSVGSEKSVLALFHELDKQVLLTFKALDQFIRKPTL